MAPSVRRAHVSRETRPHKWKARAAGWRQPRHGAGVAAAAERPAIRQRSGFGLASRFRRSLARLAPGPRRHARARVSRETPWDHAVPPPRAERIERHQVTRRQGCPQTIGSGRTDRWVRCPQVRSVGYFAMRSPPFDRHSGDRAGGRDLWPSRRGSTRSMTLLLAAVGATVMALLELTVGPYLRVGTSQPHLVLVLGVIVTVAIGLEAGLAWAFVGGLVLDVLAQRPLGSTAFALLLCVGGAVSARPTRRPSPGRRPDPGHLPAEPALLDDLFVAFNALRAPIPVADPSAASSRARLRHGPGRPHRAARRSRSMIDAPTSNGWIGDDLPRRSAATDPPACPGSSPSRSIAILAVGGLTARLFYLQIVDGGRSRRSPTRTGRCSRRSRRLAASSTTAPGALLVSNVPTFAVKLRPADLPLAQRPEVVERLAALLEINVADINATIDSNPGSNFDLVRIAGDVDEQTALLISEAGFDLPGVEIAVEARRQYTYGPLLSQVLGYTGPVSAEQLADLVRSATCPTICSARPASRRGTRPSCGARTAPRASSATPRAAGRRCSRRSARPARRLAQPDDRHEGAEVRPEGAEVGDEGGRPQARRRDRDEPADRRGPGAGQPADVRQQPVRPRDQQRRLREAARRIPTSRCSTTRPRRITRPARPTSS